MVRIDDSDPVVKCWLSPGELDHLERTAGTAGWEREIAMQLMGRCGLRVSEVSYPGTEELRWSDNGHIWLFEVQGKNTKSGARKTRDARMPENVADNIHKYSREGSFSESDSWVDASGMTPILRHSMSSSEASMGLRPNREAQVPTSYCTITSQVRGSESFVESICVIS